MQRRKVLNNDAMNAYIKLVQSREKNFATMVFVSEKRIAIIDSMREGDEEGFPSIIRDVLNLFDCFSRHSMTLEKAHVPDDSHQPSTNEWDCGLFVLYYSDFILQQKKIGFNEIWVSASRNYYFASCILNNRIL